VIADVVAVVNDAAPGLLASRRPSVVAVRTTHPKYLVFDGDPARPACVVEFGDRLRLTRRHHVLEELHSLLPDAVPASLCCRPCTSDIYAHIVAGVDGVPWFRLADGLSTPAGWRSVLDRAVSAMRRFHHAVQKVPQWRSEVSVAYALTGQLRRCLSEGGGLPRDVVDGVWSTIATTPVSLVPGFWQHGDFSLNNLMMTPQGAVIIDFDEFGRTAVPLHDAFGLAFSFPLSQPGQCPITVTECISACVEGYVDPFVGDASIVRPLLLHHLLWRINECDAHPTRAPLRSRLSDVLAHVVTCGDDWTEGVRRAFE
jgi:hypothetical protein